MWDFIQNNLIALVSLVVALFGGVPGLITAVKEWKAIPRLGGYLHNLVPIKGNAEGGGPITGLILHVGLGNKGTDPLVPLVFQLECKLNGKWISFISGSIPEGFTVQGPNWKYKYVNVEENDIRKQRKSIKRETPVYGYLVFVSSEVTFDELNEAHLTMPIRLRCIDLFGKKYEFLLNSDRKYVDGSSKSQLPIGGVELLIATD